MPTINNRIIKFRIWSPGGKKMFIPNFTYPDVDKTCDWVMMQYVGIKDSFGKEIYEGDILKLNPGRQYESNYEVIFKDGEFSLIDAKREGDKYGVFTKKLRMAIQTDSPIMIGNIFENPELLK